MGDHNDCNTNHGHQGSNTSVLGISDQRGHGDVGKKGKGKALRVRPNTKETDTSMIQNSFSGCLTRSARERLLHSFLPPGVLPTTPKSVGKTGTSNCTRSECSQSVANEENELSITDLPTDQAPEEQNANTNARRQARPQASKCCKGKDPAPKSAPPPAQPPLIRPSIVKALNLKPVELHLTQSSTGLVVTYRPWVPAYPEPRKKCPNKSKSNSFCGRRTKPRGKQYRDSTTSPRSLSPETTRETRSRSPLLQKRRSPETKRVTKSHSPRSQSPNRGAAHYSPPKKSPTPGPSWRPDELTRPRSQSPESSPHSEGYAPDEKRYREHSGHTSSKRGRNSSVSPNRKSTGTATAKMAFFGRQSPTNSKASLPLAYRGKRTPSPTPISSETAVKEVYSSWSPEKRSDRQCDKRRSRSKSPKSKSFASEGFAVSQEDIFSQPDDPRQQPQEEAASRRDRSPRRSSPASRWRPPDKDGAAYLLRSSRSASCSSSEVSDMQRGDPRDSDRERRRHRRRHRHEKETESTGKSGCHIM